MGITIREAWDPTEGIARKRPLPKLLDVPIQTVAISFQFPFVTIGFIARLAVDGLWFGWHATEDITEWLNGAPVQSEEVTVTGFS